MEGIIQWETSLGRPITALDMSPEGDKLVTGDRNGYLTCLGPDGNVGWQIRLPAKIRSAAVSSRGGNVVAGCDDGRVLVFNERGIIRWEAKADGVPSSVNISEDGAVVVVGTSTATLIRYDEGGKPLWKYGRGAKKWYQKLIRGRGGSDILYVMEHPVSSTDITWDAKFIAATTADGSTFFFDTWGTCHWQHLFKWKYTHVAISDDGCNVVAGTRSKGIVRFLNTINRGHSTYARVQEIIPSMQWAVEIDRDITSVRLSNSGEFIAVGSSEGELLLLGQDAETLWTDRLDDSIIEVCISQQGDYIAAATVSGRICLYRVVAGQACAEDFIQFADEPERSSVRQSVPIAADVIEFQYQETAKNSTPDYAPLTEDTGLDFFTSGESGSGPSAEDEITYAESSGLEFLASPAPDAGTTALHSSIGELWRRRVADILLPFSRARLLLAADGKRLVVCASSDKVIFLNGAGDSRGEFSPGQGRLVDLCGSRNLDITYAATGDELLGLAPDGRVLWRQALPVCTLCCAPAGERVAVAQTGGTITVVSQGGEKLFNGTVQGDISAIHVSKDERLIAVGASHSVSVFQGNGSKRRDLAVTGTPVFISSLSDGTIVWADQEGVFKWRPGSGSEEARRIMRLSAPAVCGAAAGKYLVVGTAGREAFLLSPATGGRPLHLPLKSVPTTAAVSGNGQWVIVGTRYRICVLAPFDGRRAPALFRFKGRIEATALDQSADRLACLVGSEVIVTTSGMGVGEPAGGGRTVDSGGVSGENVARSCDGDLEFL